MSAVKYAGYSLTTEWKEHKRGGYRYRPLKKGRSTFGEFREYHSSPGEIIYLAARLIDEQVRIRQNAWALDRALDFFLKSEVKPKFLGIAVSKDEKTRSIKPGKLIMIYMMRTADYFTHRREESWDFTGHRGVKGKSGSAQYLIDTMFFHEKWLLSDEELVDFKLSLPKK